MTVHGLEDFRAKMQQLGSPKIIKRIARKAARQGMNIVRDAARNNAKSFDDPSTTEKIHKEIVVQAGKIKDKNSVRIRVGIRGGAKKPYVNNSANRRDGRVGSAYQTGGKVYYWRFIEFGTSKMPATPFMRPALANNIEPVISKFSQIFSDELDKELAKL